MIESTAPTAPTGLLAELTHRCPLGCPYCSNPLNFDRGANEIDTATWKRVLSEAAELGVLHVHLSGGEPASRRDLVEIVAHCAKAGLYSNLITSGIGLTPKLLGALSDAGLDHVQLSIQDTNAGSADHIAGYNGAFAKKREIAKLVSAIEMPLTINAVLHKANIERAADIVVFAIELGARRVEIAHAQYYGWATVNRPALLPDRVEAEAAIAKVEQLKAHYSGIIVIDHVVPDYYARFPKACMGGWGRQSLNVTPAGKALPCHAAETIPGLEFWNVQTRSLSEIWTSSPAFAAFRGTGWMQEPCRSCARKTVDFGGCRCQALALAGDAAATDPVCHLSPRHHVIETLLVPSQNRDGYVYRRMGPAGVRPPQIIDAARNT